MPKGDQRGMMGGFQLWANLPASHKMMDPRYRDLKSAQIPEITTAGGARVRIICGEIDGTRGPVRDVVIDPEYLDVAVPAHAEFRHPTKPGHTVFVYVFEGAARFGGQTAPEAKNHDLLLFEDGDRLAVFTGEEPVRFLLISGKPLGEPIAWSGPIVMNTQEELRLAFDEYQQGTFIKKGKGR